MAGSKRKCRICACTDQRACDGGCWWIEPGLCSRCASSKAYGLIADPRGVPKTAAGKAALDRLLAADEYAMGTH
jgi:hypothetical protein